jgi:hypothetical protein
MAWAFPACRICLALSLPDKTDNLVRFSVAALLTFAAVSLFSSLPGRSQSNSCADIDKIQSVEQELPGLPGNFASIRRCFLFS